MYIMIRCNNYYKCLAKKGEHLQGMLFVVSANILRNVSHTKYVKESFRQSIWLYVYMYILDVCSIKCWYTILLYNKTFTL